MFSLNTNPHKNQTKHRIKMEAADWYSISLEDRISLRGVCGAKRGNGGQCKDANRWNKRFCWNHRFYRNPKCAHWRCNAFSRSWEGGMCVEHEKKSIRRPTSRSSYVKQKCIHCKIKVPKHAKQCSTCYTKHNVCKTCKHPDSKPFITRGGVCKKCPMIQKVKCGEAFCTLGKLNGYEYCKTCGVLNGKNMCSDCKINLRTKKGTLCVRCIKKK